MFLQFVGNTCLYYLVDVFDVIYVVKLYASITRTVISRRLNYAYRTALITRTEGRPNNAYRRYDY